MRIINKSRKISFQEIRGQTKPLTKNQKLSRRAKDQIKEMIVDTVKKQKT
jgi:hypothetical protein